MTAPHHSTRRLTAARAVGLLALALAAGVWLALRTWPSATAPACTFTRPQPPGAVTFAPSAEPPTAAPTEAPAATDAAAPPAPGTTPEVDYAAQAAAAQTQAVVRATQSPFATAQPVDVQTGQPALIVARRGGLTLQVRLPKDTYLNGETGWAEATLSNAGPDTVMVEGSFSLFSATLLDDQGREPPAWPWAPFLGPSAPPWLAPLAPGQSVTGTLVFHAAGPAPEYAFWVAARFSRTDPANPQGPDNIWLRLEAGPLPLHLLAPAPSQRLQAALQADRVGWSLRVTDAEGQAPAGPLVGGLEAASANSYGSRPLESGTNGVWTRGWADQDFGSGPIMVRAWVGAPGYVAAAVTETVGGPADPAVLFFSGSPPATWTYGSLDTAQASLGIPLYRLNSPPDSIQAEVSASSDACTITARQTYRLPAGAWLELVQSYANPAYEWAGWGDARFDPEAQALSVGGQPAYLMQSLGWWVLDWKSGNDGLELRAPVDALSRADVVALAASARR